MQNKLLKTYLERPLSWSQISQWKYDKEQWYKKYYLGKKDPENEAMRFGKLIGEKLASDPKFLPEVLRYDVMEKEFRFHLDKDLDIVGFLDSYHSKEHHILEYKTSGNKNRWTQETAQDHGQILFYAGLILLNHNVPPEKIKMRLYYIPVDMGGDFKLVIHPKEKIQHFDVEHTTLEVLQFLVDIKKIRKQMLQYIKMHE